MWWACEVRSHEERNKKWVTCNCPENQTQAPLRSGTVSHQDCLLYESVINIGLTAAIPAMESSIWCGQHPGRAASFGSFWVALACNESGPSNEPWAPAEVEN